MTAPLDGHGQPPTWLNATRRARRQMDELLGLCKGIIFDGVVTEAEVTGLDQWMKHHPDMWETWPADVVAKRLQRVLADGIVTDDEREDLRHLLEQVTGSDAETAALDDRATQLPLNDPAPSIVIPEHSFCFTGKFYFGTRSACERAIRTLGGDPHKSVTRRTDYLVVGLLGSRDWLHASFGTKIEKAMEYRNRHGAPAIVSEQAWSATLP